MKGFAGTKEVYPNIPQERIRAVSPHPQGLDAARGELVLNQVLARDDVRRSLAVEEFLNAAFPSFVETDTVDFLHDVYPCGRSADLEDGAFRQICRSQAAEGCSVTDECAKDRLDVVFIGADEEVQAFGRARFGMNAEGVGADDEVFNLVDAERA